MSIQVFSLADFDPEHASGADISAYFSVLRSTEFFSIEEFLSGLFYETDSLENNVIEFDLMLMVPPTESGLYQFELRLELTDGRVLTRTSEQVELL